MTQPNVTFLSYNSTGMNTVKSSWVRDLIKVTDASYVQVQEHFKSSKVTDKFFTDQFPDFNNFVIPAHREQIKIVVELRGAWPNCPNPNWMSRKPELNVAILEFKLSYYSFLQLESSGSMLTFLQTRN